MKTIDFPYFAERYNAGEMNNSEKQWFLNELKGEEKLRNEVRLRKLTDEVLENQNIISLRTKLYGIEQKRADVHTRKALRPVFARFVAILTGVIVIGSITFFMDRNLNSDEIINRYYNVYEYPSVQRSAQSETNNDFTLAMELYNTHQYGEAANLFNKVLERNPKDMSSEFLYGMSNLEEKNYPIAEQSFDKVISNNDSYFIEDAQWYLAWCYIKTNDRENSVKQLEIIKKEGGFYSKKAKKIIRSFK
jgi:tetratricopeptide (TPR) repeat protein